MAKVNVSEDARQFIKARTNAITVQMELCGG